MPHYYDEKQEGELRAFRIEVKVRGRTLSLWSGQGVFSKEHLDPGSALLIEQGLVGDGWNVHDLGCGIGVVGIALKLAVPSCRVLCSDVSERAVELARRNVRELNLDIDVRHSDGYANIPECFDTVLLNPPYVAGRAVVFKLIDEAAEHLVPGGVVQVVARHSKGGEMIKKHLVDLVGNCDDSRRRGGYRIYVAQKKA